MRTLLAAAIAVLVGGCPHAKPRKPMTWPALDAQLLADAAATYNFRLGQPNALAVTADGAVLFRRTPPREFVADLYEFDVMTGTEKRLVSVAELLATGDEQLSDAEKARRERSRTATRGVVDIDVSTDGRSVLVPLAGKFYLIDRSTGQRRAIDPGGSAYDPHLAPDGSRIAFVRDGDLWIIDVAGGAARRLTQHPEGLEYAVADFAAQEELGRTRGYWWSPDSKQLVFQRSDTRKMDTLYVADPRHPEKPPVPFKYPRAGRPNATVDLGVIAVSGGEPRWLTWSLDKYPYLARVAWTAHGPLSIVVLSREQQDLALIAFDATGESKTLLTEHDNAWVNVPSSRAGMGYKPGAPLWLPDGTFLWMTESFGDAWTLELRSRDGALVRRVTKPDLGLRELIGVENNMAIVQASADPLYSSIWRVPLDGGEPVAGSKDRGVITGDYENGVLVMSMSLQSGGKRVAVVKDAAMSRDLTSVAEQPKLVPTTKVESVTVEGRTHYVAITRPRGFDPDRKYPVLLKVYAGPHAQYVDNARDGYVMDQWYADAGFIVVRSDNRGTPHRGAKWERAIVEDLITVPLADQVGALQAVGARYKELDMTRVGVTGWSFGGYFAAMAVLLRPDVFHAAVAGAPVTDWRLYDTAYTERYMRMPEHNVAGYERTSALTHAAKLSRPLLLVHGITDDNVHFAHTLALIEALYVAHKRAEVITLSSTHMVPDPKLNLAKEQVQIDFFRQHLGR
ncbi:MAG TPA: DPP IV N-terminal domain-containing protein [Kofleriaceae bacterium]